MAALAHRPTGGVAGEQHRPHHDVERGLLLGQVVVEEGAPQPEAGVVDEQVDRAQVVLEAGAHPAGRRAVGEVGDEHLDRHAVALPQPARELLEAGPVAGDEHEVGALAGEAFGEGPADARGGAGDECGAHGGGLYAANLRPGCAPYPWVG